MVIVDKFTLLKGVDNLLDYSPKQIQKFSLKNGQPMLQSALQLSRSFITHFSDKKIFSIIDKKISDIAVVSLSDYSLYSSYNPQSKQIVFNIFPFGVESISANRPDPKNMYACLVHGVCFRNIVTGKYKIKESYFDTIVSFLLSMIIQMFGKEYALLGKYADQIPKLKFLISCYVLVSFFGFKKDQILKHASLVSGFDSNEIGDEFEKYPMNNIDSFLEACSALKALPGMTKYHFTSRAYKFLGVNFLPAFEDMSRFVATIAATSVPGETIYPSFIIKYNRDEYAKILMMAKLAIA
jgi:hypothetical protein